MRYRRVKIPGVSYFFTVVTHDRKPLFRYDENVERLRVAFEAVRAKHSFETNAYVILPDHIHTIWTLPTGDANYSKRWRLIKEAFTRSYLKAYGPLVRTRQQEQRGEQPIWQRRFWEHTILDDEDYDKHVDYIHLNPVNHGYVLAPRDWLQSSFREWVDAGAYEATWGSDQSPELPAWAKRHE